MFGNTALFVSLHWIRFFCMASAYLYWPQLPVWTTKAHEILWALRVMHRLCWDANTGNSCINEGRYGFPASYHIQPHTTPADGSLILKLVSIFTGWFPSYTEVKFCARSLACFSIKSTETKRTLSVITAHISHCTNHNSSSPFIPPLPPSISTQESNILFMPFLQFSLGRNFSTIAYFTCCISAWKYVTRFPLKISVFPLDWGSDSLSFSSAHPQQQFELQGQVTCHDSSLKDWIGF